MAYKNELVWVIGGSSGIGYALCHELLKRGATVAVSARSLDSIMALELEYPTKIKRYPLDVTDAEATRATAQSIHDDMGVIDRVLHMAAAYLPMTLDQLDMKQVRHIISVNLTSSFGVLDACLGVFAKQGNRPQLAMCASVAGYHGLPAGQPYSATKAAMINLAESMVIELGDRVDVRLICPGFVRTPLTDQNQFKMPMLLEPNEAAIEILNGLTTRRFHIHFPKRFTRLVGLLRWLPYCVTVPLLRWVAPSKGV